MTLRVNRDIEKGEEGFMGEVRPERDVVSEMISKSNSDSLSSSSEPRRPGLTRP
jgi:hypothetical protein